MAENIEQIRPDSGEHSTRRASKKRSAKSTSTASTTGGRGRGTGRGRETDSNRESIEKSSEIPVIVSVENNEAVETEKVKKDTKPKQVRKRKKKNNTAEQISGFIQSISLLVASRPNHEHWAISKEEADKVAEPLTNILEESDLFNKVAEHSDAIALVTATSMIVIPRAMVEIELQKSKPKKKGRKKIESEHRNAEPKRADENGKSVGSDRKNDGESTAVYQTNDDSILAIVPAIM